MTPGPRHLMTTWLDAADMFRVHTAHSLLVTAFAENIFEARGALGVGVEVLTDPTMLLISPTATMASSQM
jgi:hypothetical protein